jgi:hypothetical protein
MKPNWKYHYSVDNTKAVNETVSKLLNNKDENQSIRIELINKNGNLPNHYLI